MFPIISIDPQKAHRLNREIVLQKLYYTPEGDYRTAKKLQEACEKDGYRFVINKIRDWLERQVLYQIHMSRPKFIPYASFNNITIPMEVIQADILYMPYDKVGDIMYMFCLTVIDVASRYKGAVPIGTSLDILNMDADEFTLKNILTSAVVVDVFNKLFNDPNNLFRLYKVKTVITDKGSEFKKNFDIYL